MKLAMKLLTAVGKDQCGKRRGLVVGFSMIHSQTGRPLPEDVLEISALRAIMHTDNSVTLSTLLIQSFVCLCFAICGARMWMLFAVMCVVPAVRRLLGILLERFFEQRLFDAIVRHRLTGPLPLDDEDDIEP